LTEQPPVSWFRRLGATAVVVVVTLLFAIGLWKADAEDLLWLALFGLVLVAAAVFGGLLPALQKRRVRRFLQGRPPLAAATFGETYFRDLPRGPEVAAAVRRKIEENVGMELPGMRPDDRLDELRVELDPVFFDELAHEFGFNPPANYPDFSALAASMNSVRDVVEYVAEKAESPSE
jgi:hypothetical protein